MTLTPVPLPVPRFAAQQAGQDGILQPLCVGAPDSRSRLSQLLRAMCGDLLGRVLLDRRTEGRWPGKLGVGLVTHGPKVCQCCSSPSFQLFQKFSHICWVMSMSSKANFQADNYMPLCLRYVGFRL